MPPHTRVLARHTGTESPAKKIKRRCTLLQQTGVGKGDAVRLGFANASGDMLMILDDDMTVPPEDLPRFNVPIPAFTLHTPTALN